MLDRLKRQWILHIKDNIPVYLLVLFIFITGIMAGTFTVISLPSSQKVGVSSFLREFFNSQQSLTINKWTIFRESLWQHFLGFFLIWLFGLISWGPPFVLGIIGIRGFSFGFTVGFMIEHYRIKGALFTLICILPQGIIYVPCYLVMGVIGINYSIHRFRKGGQGYRHDPYINEIGVYTRKSLSFLFLTLLGVLIETFIAPIFFPMFAWVFG